MKILIFSDSHGWPEPMRNVLRKVKGEVSAVVHLGDGAGDAYALSKEYPSLVFHSVLGNCDYGFGERVKTFSCGGNKVLITHGHTQHVKGSLLRLSLFAEENEADICLFGHTHTPALVRHGKILLMNPGSVSLPKHGHGTYGVLDIADDGVVTPSIVEMKGSVFTPIDCWMDPY
jgi:putative phosphoesterase